MSKISHTDVVDEGPFPETIVVAHLDGTSRAYVRADGPELQETIDRAVAAEREACALLCDDEGLHFKLDSERAGNPRPGCRAPFARRIAPAAGHPHQCRHPHAVEPGGAELAAEQAASFVHLRRDGAIGKHLTKRVDDTPMGHRRTCFGINGPHWRRHRIVLQSPPCGLAEIVSTGRRASGSVLTGHGAVLRCGAPSAGWPRW